MTLVQPQLRIRESVIWNKCGSQSGAQCDGKHCAARVKPCNNASVSFPRPPGFHLLAVLKHAAGFTAGSEWQQNYEVPQYALAAI